MSGKTITTFDERLYRAAVLLVLHERKASTSFLQRIMEVRFKKACALLERMEEEGVISKPDENGERQFFRDAPEPWKRPHRSRDPLRRWLFHISTLCGYRPCPRAKSAAATARFSKSGSACSCFIVLLDRFACCAANWPELTNGPFL